MTKNGESIIASVSQIFYVFLDWIANEVRVRAFFSSPVTKRARAREIKKCKNLQDFGCDSFEQIGLRTRYIWAHGQQTSKKAGFFVATKFLREIIRKCPNICSRMLFGTADKNRETRRQGSCIFMLKQLSFFGCTLTGSFTWCKWSSKIFCVGEFCKHGIVLSHLIHLTWAQCAFSRFVLSSKMIKHPFWSVQVRSIGFFLR